MKDLIYHLKKPIWALVFMFLIFMMYANFNGSTFTNEVARNIGTSFATLLISFVSTLYCAIVMAVTNLFKEIPQYVWFICGIVAIVTIFAKWAPNTGLGILVKLGIYKFWRDLRNAGLQTKQAAWPVKKADE